MLFNTQLELNITIKDINAIYSTNYDNMLLDHAKLMYEGQCRDGQYVKSINHLVKRSLPNLIQRDLDAKIRIYVVVNATVIRYDQYDIISGMKINKIIPAGKIGNFAMLECRNDHVVALMRIKDSKDNFDNFTVGDIIPIRVGQSMYKIGNQHILVNGYPFVPYTPDRIFYSLGESNPSNESYYNEMVVPLIERELARKNKLDQSRWDTFSKMLHPYKSEEVNSKKINILDVKSLGKGIFSINYKSNMSNLEFSISESDSIGSINIVDESHNTAFMRMGFQFVKWLEVLNDLTEQYSNDEEFNHLNHVWNLYNQHKF